LRNGPSPDSDWAYARSPSTFDIKLKNPLPSNDRLSESWPAYKRLNDSLMNGVKNNLLGGYDLFLNPQDEFLRDADWFIAECKKRMEANKS
jgi:hypothetical protein